MAYLGEAEAMSKGLRDFLGYCKDEESQAPCRTPNRGGTGPEALLVDLQWSHLHSIKPFSGFLVKGAE